MGRAAISSRLVRIRIEKRDLTEAVGGEVEAAELVCLPGREGEVVDARNESHRTSQRKT